MPDITLGPGNATRGKIFQTSCIQKTVSEERICQGELSVFRETILLYTTTVH